MVEWFEEGGLERTPRDGLDERLADATAALDRDEPLYALALGRDLHWADPDELRADALALMTQGYCMLGREALAAMAEVHHANRDLAHVGIYD